MQKKIIALAVAGLVSGGAFAQSNVTISGQFKVGVDSISAGGATAANSNYTSRTRVVDNNSNLRFSGSEDLGGGLKAIFQVEQALGTDNYDGTGAGNTSGTRFASWGSRDTWVGLSGNWGTVQLGKYSVHYGDMTNVEIAGLAEGLAMATSSLNLLNTINGTSLIGSTRLQNAMVYQSPNFSGFDARIAYSTQSEATTPLLTNKDNALHIKLGYNNGPINFTYAYLAVNDSGATTTAGTSGSDVRSDRLGIAYTFPMGFKLGLIWDGSKNTNNTVANTSTYVKRNAWALPVSYTTGAHKISATYAKTGKVNTQAGTTADTDAKMWMLGYEYNLSKRTSLSASYTAITNSAAATYDFWHPSSNVANGGGVLGNAGADPRVWSFNVTHKF